MALFFFKQWVSVREKEKKIKIKWELSQSPNLLPSDSDLAVSRSSNGVFWVCFDRDTTVRNVRIEAAQHVFAATPRLW